MAKIRNLQNRVNPIQLQRIRLDMTQDKLTAVAGVSKPLVMRIEQGLISNVSQDVLNALFPKHEQAKALDEYDAWIRDTRSKNIRYFNDTVDDPFRYDGSWLSFRTNIHNTAVGFCKLYCIHPQVLSNFEKPHLVYKRRGLSPYLKEVFDSAGKSRIEKLEERMTYYADSRGMLDG